MSVFRSGSTPRPAADQAAMAPCRGQDWCYTAYQAHDIGQVHLQAVKDDAGYAQQAISIFVALVPEYHSKAGHTGMSALDW